MSFKFYWEGKVPGHIVKKNSRPIFMHGSRPFIGKSKELQMAESYLTTMLKIKKTETIVDQVWVKYHFIYGPMHKRAFALTDLSNLFELPNDCLQASGVLKNDRQIKSFDGSRMFIGPETILKIWVSGYNVEEGDK